MAKGANNKLTKLKSVLKKLNSFNTKHHHHQQPQTPQAHCHVSSSAVSASPDDFVSGSGAGQFRTVYVGRARRPYLVSSDVVSHPLFQQLADLSSSNDGGEISVSCEVVLFEHLLWMLDNADESHPESLHELVEFYAC